MKKVKEIITEYKNPIITVLLFFVFFTIYRIVPPVQDALASSDYYNNSNGIFNFIKYICVDFYKFINGRISLNIIDGIIESFKSEILLDTFNALIITGIFVLVSKIFKIEKNYNKCMLFFVSLFLLISAEMRCEVTFYANVAYITPVFLILLYYYFYKKIFEEESNKKINKYILYMSIIGFMICTWMEHIGVGFGLTIVIIEIINIIKHKKHTKKLCVPIITSLIGGLIMILSPGLTLSREVISTTTSTYIVIKNNILLFKHYIISENTLIFFVAFLIMLVFFIKNKTMKKWIKSISLFITTIDLLMIIGVNIAAYLNIEFLSNFNIFFMSYSPYQRLSLQSLLVIILLTPFLLTILQSKKIKDLGYILGTTVFSLMPILLTPNNGTRIAFIGILFVILFSTVIFDELYDEKLALKHFINIGLIIIILVSADQSILLCRRIYNIQTKREKIISEAVVQQALNTFDYKKYIVLPAFSENDILYGGVYNEKTFYYPQFLNHYNLNENTKIIFTNSLTVSTFAHYSVDDGKISASVVNGKDNTKYMYIVKYSVDNSYYSDIYNSGFLDNDEFVYDQFTSGYGFYKMVTYYQSENSSQPQMINQEYIYNYEKK